MKFRAAVLLVVLLATAGCSVTTSDGSGDGPSDSPSDPASPSGSSTPARVAGGFEYVAIGDSYTAAPGVEPTAPDTGCFRSAVNYPALVAEGLPGATLTDVSCSGADTRDLTREQQTLGGPVPPQLDAVSPTTDLVTVGLGGNDFNVFVTLVSYCSRLSSSDPTGAPCSDALGDRLVPLLDRTGDRLEAVLRKIGRRAPDAEVLVVGYPELVGARDTCPDLFPIATGDYRFARLVGKQLNQALRDAARATGSGYVDVARASRGHDICSADPWVNGGASTVGAQVYHPFAAEQRAVADLVIDRVSDRVG